MARFTDLPVEIVAMIVQHLTHIELIHMQCVCKSLCTLVQSIVAPEDLQEACWKVEEPELWFGTHPNPVMRSDIHLRTNRWIDRDTLLILQSVYPQVFTLPQYYYDMLDMEPEETTNPYYFTTWKEVVYLNQQKKYHKWLIKHRRPLVLPELQTINRLVDQWTHSSQEQTSLPTFARQVLDTA